MSVLVLGLGNILMRDEGLGVHIARTLEDRFLLPSEVEVIDGGTCGMDLLDAISGRDLLLVTDAIRSEKAPGTVIRLADDEVLAFFRSRISPHQLGLSDVLAFLALSGDPPKRVVIVGVVPEDLSLGMGLSRTAFRACDAALGLVIDELGDRGLYCETVAAAVNG